VCFRAEAKTVETLDNIADTLDQSRADLLLSMTKFALANHDWARFGLTHRPLPYGYGVQPATNPAPIWKRKRPKSLGKPVPLTPKQKAAAKAMAKAAGRKYPNLVDNIAASRKVNPMKKPSTIDKSMDLDTLAERVFTDGDWPSDYLEIAKALRSILVRDKRAYGWTTIGSVEDVDWFRSVKEATNKVRGSTRKVNPMKKPTPAQLAARAKFAAMARSGAFKRKAKAKAAPKVKTSAGSYKVMTRDGDIEIEGVTMAQAKKYIADRAKKTKRFAGFWSVVKANPLGVAGGRYEILWGGSGDLKASYDDLGQAKDFLDDIDRPPGLFYGRDTKTGKHFFSFAAVTKFPNIDIRGTAMQKAYKEAYKTNPRKKTVSEKISQLVREGYPQKQAVAVALSEERAGKVKRNPRAANPITGTYGPFYGDPDAELTGTQIEDMAERYMDRLDRQLMRGDITQPQYEREVRALNKWAKEKYSKRKRNPATGAKKSRTKLNPVRDFYYVVKCGQYYDGQFSSKHYTLDEVKKIAQQKADKYGCPAKITEIH
jgi:hypothetical protein